MDAPAERLVARAFPESDAQLRGRRLGDFVLHECIGEGAFAAVYRCEQPLLGREAVVKVLHQRLRESEVMLQRFMREARLASRLSHPYAAHVYAFGVEPEDGLAWIAMEFVHGTSLEHWLEQRGPLSLEVLVPFIENVAEVVQDAHDHGIIHRDLKPSNVMMIEHAGRLLPKLLDFGIAKLVDETAQFEMPGVPVEVNGEVDTSPALTDSGNQKLTQANATLGSPPYMSPEQWCDPLSAGPRSDLYSLAVMVYEALTGKQPFTGDTIAMIGERHCNAEVPSIGEGFPPALDRVLQRALAKSPNDRPASAIAFASELRAAVFLPGENERSGRLVLERSGRLVLDPSGRQAVEPSGQVVELPLPARPAKRKSWPLAAGAATLVAGGALAYLLLARPSEDLASSRAPIAVVPAVLPTPPPVQAVAAAPAQVVATPAPPVQAPATVVVEIESAPLGAEVYRLPSETKVGATPFRAELPSEAGVQVFVLKKPGFADRRVEVDLRTGGTHHVKLPRLTRRSVPAGPAGPAGQSAPSRSPAGDSASARHKGEPVDPFATTKAP